MTTTKIEVGLISGSGDDPLNFEVPKLRERGFVDELESVDITLDPTLVAGGNFSIDGGQEAMASLLDTAEPPTAVFAMSDEMAFGALLELDARNLVAGIDISVIGVDDHEFARVVGLSTIRQLVASQGAVAARSLLSALRREEVPSRPTISPVELVLRSTTGPPR